MPPACQQGADWWQPLSPDQCPQRACKESVLSQTGRIPSSCARVTKLPNRNWHNPDPVRKSSSDIGCGAQAAPQPHCPFQLGAFLLKDQTGKTTLYEKGWIQAELTLKGSAQQTELLWVDRKQLPESRLYVTFCHEGPTATPSQNANCFIKRCAMDQTEMTQDAIVH